MEVSAIKRPNPCRCCQLRYCCKVNNCRAFIPDDSCLRCAHWKQTDQYCDLYGGDGFYLCVDFISLNDDEKEDS